MTSKRCFLTRRKLTIMLGVLIVCGALPGLAQDIMLPRDVPPRVKKHKPKPDFIPTLIKRTPAFAIPVGILGYGPPSLTYLGRHYSVISLDFLDEDRLLFSFRAPGLLEREAVTGSSSRQMKAVVLRIPEGKVEAETVWKVPDYSRYLWPLEGGRFLLRDREGLKIGDTSLQTKLLAPLNGEFLGLEMAPQGKVLVASTLDPTAETPETTDKKKYTPPTPIAVRAIDLTSGKVLQMKHATSALALPVSSEGSLELVHDKYDQWALKLNTFAGGSTVLGKVESTCRPSAALLSEKDVLVTGCNPTHVPKIESVSKSGQVEWESEIPLSFVPPLMVMAQNGSRFARESIVLKRQPYAGNETLWVKAVKGQVVRIFDAATGNVVLELPISPILDAGGNVAISPSGRKIAVLNVDSIEVYELPAAPAGATN